MLWCGAAPSSHSTRYWPKEMQNWDSCSALSGGGTCDKDACKVHLQKLLFVGGFGVVALFWARLCWGGRTQLRTAHDFEPYWQVMGLAPLQLEHHTISSWPVLAPLFFQSPGNWVCLLLFLIFSVSWEININLWNSWLTLRKSPAWLFCVFGRK